MGGVNSIPEVPKTMSCTEMPGKPGSAPRRRGATWGSLQATPWPEEPHINNLYENFLRGADKYPQNSCMGTRTFVDGKATDFAWLNYKDAAERARHIGEGCRELGLAKGISVGIYSQNRPEWMLSSLGVWSAGCVCVPLYDTLGENAVAYQLEHAEIALVFAEKSKLGLLEKALGSTRSLHTVVQFEDSVDAATKDRFLASGKALLSLKELEGRARDLPKVQVDPGNLAFIMYTSGTTGNPKGAMLTHGNVMASVSSGLNVCKVAPSDRYLSYLPLAHIFETLMQGAMYSCGAAVGFYQGDTRKILEDVQALQPTIFAGVPRIYQRIYEKATSSIEAKSNLQQGLFNMALRREKRLARDKGRHSRIAAKICKKVREALGGRVKFIISGAAPLPAHIAEFLQLTMHCPVVQGYGMTENTACAAMQFAGDCTAGQVGGPAAPAEVKLVDVEEMGYVTGHADMLPRGEICTRGPTVFLGYWKNEVATGETIDADGWLHTGDIGQWNENGSLSIIDRKKNIFKLLQGEYVAAEKIEETFSKSRMISQVWVYGHSETTQLVAVVVVDFENLLPWAKAEGIACPGELKEVIEGGAAELCSTKQVQDLILNEFKRLAKEDGLKGFEVPKAVHLESSVNNLLQGFNVENDCLTPTFKLRRPQLRQRYQAQISEMYSSLGERLPEENK